MEKDQSKMGIPKEVTNESPEFFGVDGRPKGSKKSERDKYLEGQVENLKAALNGANDKVKALKATFQRSIDDQKAVNDKLQEDNMKLVEKHDSRLMKFMELSDQADVMEEALKNLGYGPDGKPLENDGD